MTALNANRTVRYYFYVIWLGHRNAQYGVRYDESMTISKSLGLNMGFIPYLFFKQSDGLSINLQLPSARDSQSVELAMDLLIIIYFFKFRLRVVRVRAKWIS